MTSTSVEKPIKKLPKDRTVGPALGLWCRASHFLSSTGTRGIQTKIIGSSHHTIVTGLMTITS